MAQAPSEWIETACKYQFISLATDFQLDLGLDFNSDTLIDFELNYSIVTLVVCFRLFSCWEMNLCPNHKILQTVTDFIWVLHCIYFHPSSHQLWPASLSLLKKSICIAWCCFYHILKWCWYAHYVLHWDQKVEFWSNLTRVLSFRCLLHLSHGLWQTSNGNYGFLSTMAFFSYYSSIKAIFVYCMTNSFSVNRFIHLSCRYL